MHLTGISFAFGTHRVARRAIISMIRTLQLAALTFLLAATAPSALAFGFADVDRRARELAGRAYVRSAPPIPKQLKDLGYDQTRDIRFDPSRALWREQKLPFEVQFFHLGGFFDQPVRVYRSSDPLHPQVYHRGEMAEAEPAVPGWSMPRWARLATPGNRT